MILRTFRFLERKAEKMYKAVCGRKEENRALRSTNVVLQVQMQPVQLNQAVLEKQPAVRIGNNPRAEDSNKLDEKREVQANLIASFKTQLADARGASVPHLTVRATTIGDRLHNLATQSSQALRQEEAYDRVFVKHDSLC